MIADGLSHSNQILGAELSLCKEVFQEVLHTLFVSPERPSRTISKCAIRYFLRDVCSKTMGPHNTPGPSSRLRAHSVRRMATSASLMHVLKSVGICIHSLHPFT